MTEANVTNPFASNKTYDTTAKNQGNIINCDTTEPAKQIRDDTLNERANNTVLSQNKLDLVFNLTTNANVNKLQNADTLLKYIYKGDENKSVANKENGHSRNSLKRKKRSEFTPRNQYVQNPANFKYTTVHDVESKDKSNNQVNRANIVQSADMANYNIETVHSHLPTTENYYNSQNTDSESTSVPDLPGQSKNNNNYQDSNEDTSRNVETSSEETDNKFSSNESKINDRGESNETSEENYQEEQNHNSGSKEFIDNSDENNHPNEESNEKYKQHSSDESNENHESLGDDRLVESNHDNNIFDSKDRSLEENSDEKQPLKSESSEDNSSSIESIESPRNSPFPKHKSTNATSENFTSDIDPNLFFEDSIENSEVESQTHINDDEVKPVIELHNEDHSDEHSKEISDGPHSLPLQNHGNDDHREDITKNVDNVKQQFERIPLNYKHKDEEINKDFTPVHNSKTPENDEVDDRHKTLDNTTSDDERYDKNLHFKFDYVPIKLPKIELPDDILDYAYEPISKNEDVEDSKTYKTNKYDKKWPYHTYKPESDDYGLDGSDKKRKSKYSDKITERKTNDKSNEDDGDEEEDLYEKFVRERFGKRGSFAKRSEKLQIKPEVNNRQLFNRIQNVLKRTEDIQKEAEKSADPNANYLWTLEYGEKM